MNEFDEIVIEYFLKHQTQLFDEPVCETPEEAEEFLSDCMAVVLDKYASVAEFLDEEGMDVSGMTKEEVLDQAEVFCLPDGRFLIVEG